MAVGRMASPAPSRPTPREPDRRKCRRPPTMPQPPVAHPPGEPPDSSFLSPSRWFPPILRHRAIIQLPDLGSFSHFVLNGLGFQIFGDLVQLRGPNSELLDNFRLGDGLLQIATLSCQLPKIAYILH